MAEFIDALNIDISSGSGAPTHVARKGSLYINTTATTNVTRAYLNTNGISTWTAINTVA